MTIVKLDKMFYMQDVPELSLFFLKIFYQFGIFFFLIKSIYLKYLLMLQMEIIISLIIYSKFSKKSYL